MFLLQIYFFPKQTRSAGFMNEVWEKKTTRDRRFGLVWFCPSLKKKTPPQTNQPNKQKKKKEKRWRICSLKFLMLHGLE